MKICYVFRKRLSVARINVCMSNFNKWLFITPLFLHITCVSTKNQTIYTAPQLADSVSCCPFSPAPVPETQPSYFDYRYDVLLTDSSAAALSFCFCDTSYSMIDGVVTFRGNNFRNGAMYGTVNMSEKKLEKIWVNKVGRLDKWTGFGWTGQPAAVKWRKEIVALSNVRDTFKTLDNFVEVICGSLDGKVHFYDLYSGKPSRPTISLPASIKGSVWVDPRGLPLLYVGQGIDEVDKKNVPIGFYIYSLLDGSRLHFVNGIDTFAFRHWGAFDGNGLICKETDSMFLVGENGVAYAGRLNTQFDTIKGTINVAPQWYKYRYKTAKNIKSRLGSENSAAAYSHFAFFADNCGMLQCIDMNTLAPVWAQYLGDDTDASTAIDKEENDVFLYTGCEVDLRAQKSPAYLYKINAVTGEIVWKKSYLCVYDKEVNGGLLSSPLIGQHNLRQLVFFSVAKTGDGKGGKLLAFNKATGELAWEFTMKYYTWSSPIAVYNENNEGFLVLADSKGAVYLMDGLTGEIADTINLDGENIEASPAAYGNMLVVGTRGQQLHGIKIK